MTTYAVLHGPRSGRRGAGSVGATVVRQLRSAGHEVRELETSTIGSAQQACRVAVTDSVDVLVAVGGDGLVQLVANEISGTATALGIVAAGTGNDNARSLRIPLETDDAVSNLLRGTRRTIDLIHVDACDRLVVGSVPCGLDALIATRATSLPRWLGRQSYALATLREIVRLRPMEYRIEVDDTVLEVPALVVAVCNMPFYGGGMRIAPAADPGDGLLDIVIISPVGPGAALSLLRGVFSGGHTSHPAVRIERASRVRIAGPALTVAGDGEALAPLPVTCTATPGALQVVAPVP